MNSNLCSAGGRTKHGNKEVHCKTSCLLLSSLFSAVENVIYCGPVLSLEYMVPVIFYQLGELA